MSSTLTLFSLQGFFSRKTNFYFHQFLSNFFKNSISSFLLSHLYNIFTIYFFSNYPLIKSLSSTISNCSCFFTFALILLSYSAIISFVFSKSLFLFCKKTCLCTKIKSSNFVTSPTKPCSIVICKSTCPETTSPWWSHLQNIQAHLSRNMSHGSTVIIQVFCLPQWRYSYSTWSSMTELLLSVSQHWNLCLG